MVYLTRAEHFNAAHKLANPNWSKEKNEEVFGKCANHNWHGHNFELWVTVKGIPDADTGFIMNLKLLSQLVKTHIIEALDHKNLNLDVAQFANVNPTAENIAVVIHTMLRPHVPAHLDLHVILGETPRNIVQYPADIMHHA